MRHGNQCSPGKAAGSAGVREQAALHTSDKGAEVGLLLAKPSLELAQVLLARLDLVLTEIHVGLEAGLALVELRLSAFDLERAVLDLLLLLLEPLRAPLEPFGGNQRSPKRSSSSCSAEGTGAGPGTGTGVAGCTAASGDDVIAKMLMLVTDDLWRRRRLTRVA